MGRIFFSSLLLLLLLGVSVTDATAGRFGGARSFHSVRSSSLFSHSYGARTPKHVPIPRKATASKSRGMLSGLLMGGLLASLFMGHGFGSMFLSWLLLGMAIMMIIRLFSRPKTRETEQRFD